MICGASYKKPVSCVATGHRRGSQADSLSGLVMSDRFAGFLVYMIGFMLKRKKKFVGPLYSMKLEEIMPDISLKTT